MPGLSTRFFNPTGPIRGPGTGASWTIAPINRTGRVPLKTYLEDSGGLKPVSSTTLSTRSWQWFTDATPDASMVSLANEGIVPALSGAQMQNQIIRLRAQVEESAGNAVTLTDLRVQMSVNDSTWQEIQAQVPVNNLEGIWFRHGAGTATNGATIGTNLLTGTTTSGSYIEDKISDPTINGFEVKEFDFAVYVHWPRPDTTVRFRLVYGAGPTIIPAGAGWPQIQLRTSTAAERPYTITALDPDALQQTCRELRFGAWPRVFWDSGSSLWWLFTVQYNSPTQLVYFTWDGSGSWSGPSTTTFSTDGNQSRHAVWVANGKVYAMFGSSSTNRHLKRGVISGSSITWDTEQTIAQASDRHRHITVDDGGFVWIGGVTAATGVWARRATSADSVTAFNAVKTAADAGVVSGDVFAMIGLTSDKALCVWRSGSVLKSATVTDAGGFSAVTQVNSTAVADDEDWGMVRDVANGFVYVSHSDSTAAGGNWILRVFNVGTGSWSSTTNASGVNGQTSDNDGLPMTIDGSDVYICGTFPNSEGGQDRKLRYIKYTGPGTGGTWGTLTDLTPAGSRCNGDHISTSPVAANNKALWIWDVSDDGAGDVPGTGFALEYHYLALGTVASIGLATETDSAFSVTPSAGDVSVAIGLATETDTAFAVTPVGGDVAVAVGLATDTETSFAITPLAGDVTVTIGLATETDAAFTITTVGGDASLAFGLVTETDTAFAIVPAPETVSVAIDLATETNTAFDITPVVDGSGSIGLATETDTAFSITPVGGDVSVAAGLAIETDTAFTVTPLAGDVDVAIGLASETDTAFNITTTAGNVDVAIGLAIEADSAFTITGTTPGQVAIGQSIETDTAFDIAPVGGAISLSVGLASDTETAFSITPTVDSLVNIGLVTETDTAFSVTPAVGGSFASIEIAVESDTALSITPLAGTALVSIGLTQETNTALSISATPGESLVTIGIATEVDTAFLISVVSGNVSVPVGIATEFDIALPFVTGDPIPVKFLIQVRSSFSTRSVRTLSTRIVRAKLPVFKFIEGTSSFIQ